MSSTGSIFSGGPRSCGANNTTRRKALSQPRRSGALQIIGSAILIVLSGCGSRDIFTPMIKQLGGPPAEQRKAALELKLTSKDPVPALLKAAGQTKKYPTRTRIKVVEVLGDIARRQNDNRAKDFLTTMLNHSDTNLLLQAVISLNDTEHYAAASRLAAIRSEYAGRLREAAEHSLASILRHQVKKIERKWNSPTTAMDLYQQADKNGLGRTIIGISKAQFLENRGRIEEANSLYRELGMIRMWWLMGTFPNIQGAGFHKKYPPESEIDLDAMYWTGKEQAGWYKMETPAHNGFVDFEGFFVDTDNVVGYGLIFAHCEEEQDIEIRTGSDDTLTIFLNNELIWAHEQYRALSFDDDVVPVTLKAGTNTILFKVCEDWGNWSLTARLTGPGCSPLKNVIYNDQSTHTSERVILQD